MDARPIRTVCFTASKQRPLLHLLAGWVFTALAAIPTESGNAAYGAPRASVPNVVLVMADDQGWGETGYNGHPYLKTPVLDQMAQSGLRFDRFYAGAPNCTPTRTSVLTGRNANRSGAFAPNWSTRPQEITIAQILKQAGYRTGHFGKWHVGAVKAESPVNPGKLGFEEYLSHDNFFELSPMLSHNGATPEKHEGESSEIVAAAAAKFARQVAAEGKPFFIVLWFGSPHGPYSGLKQDIALYKDVPQEQLRLRLAEITAMDRAIGRFRDALQELGQRDNTLLWYNSDNGLPRDVPGFDAGWRGRKGSVYEGGLRVPAIVEWPAVIRSPRTTNLPCVTYDILPTLMELLELKFPDPDRPLDGISLAALVKGDTLDKRPRPIGFWKYPTSGEKQNGRYISEELARGTTPTTRNPAIDFTNFKHPQAGKPPFGGEAAWTDNQYKLVRAANRSGAGKAELFDLVADPQEKTNLAGDHPDVVRRMTAELQAWQQSVERSLTGADY
jgi:arylsulfatase A-like enzyme